MDYTDGLNSLIHAENSEELDLDFLANGVQGTQFSGAHCPPYWHLTMEATSEQPL